MLTLFYICELQRIRLVEGNGGRGNLKVGHAHPDMNI